MATERELPFSNPHIDYRRVQRNSREPNVKSNQTPTVERLFQTGRPESLLEALMQQGPTDALDLSYEMRPVIEAVAGWIDQLPDDQRDVIEAVFYERTPLSELGKRLGCSKTHAWRQRNAAMESLGNLLRNDPTIRSKYMRASTWEEAANNWVLSFSEGQSLPNEIDINSPIRLRDMIVRAHSNSGKVGPISAFRGIAYDAIGELRHKDQWDANAMTDLLVSKQRDYGHGNIDAFGIYGVLVRLSDKIERLKNLMSNDIDPSNESVLDTLRDMVGYCVIANMIDEDTFRLPLGGAR